jgi:2-methylcitrate synthase
MREAGTEADIRRGLEGVVVDTTAVSKVVADKSILIYRGYEVSALAEGRSFEEVAYLLWHGELPSHTQLAAFQEQERRLRPISDALLSAIRLFPRSAHPMDTVRTGVSFLGMEDPNPGDQSAEANLERALLLQAKIPTIIASDYRIRRGQEPIAPRGDLSISENFFHMCFGEVPEPEVVRAFDASLILYAEHGFNASTFTARVVVSSLSDIYSALTAAIGSLKGPLHGGANEAVMHMLQEVGTPDRAEEWLLDALKEKRKVMGFGHRVYKTGDSRVPTMKKYAQKMSDLKGEGHWTEISRILEATMIREKNIYPNLDFPAGPAYFLMGFDINMFTPIFVIARTSGWTAHVMEQLAHNRLIRPLSHYDGQEERSLPE